jgi:DNA (cytosine-5)-methyltransferase 1
VQEAAISNAARDLAGLGYRTDYRCISGADAGAHHQRDRWWLVAHPYDEGEFRRALNAEVAELQTLCRGVWGPANYARAIRVPDGLPDRMDRLARLGNAVIPMIPNEIGRAIMAMA